MTAKQKKATAAAELLKFARDASQLITTWEGLHNAIYGIGGKFGELFPDQASRTAFAKSEEFQEIAKLIRSRQSEAGADPDDEAASGRFVLRLPESLHRAVAVEAKAEGVSLNQLCVAKLAMQLRALVKKGG